VELVGVELAKVLFRRGVVKVALPAKLFDPRKDRHVPLAHDLMAL
jgi:hypothetical protein